MTDLDLQHDVVDALESSAEIESSRVGVSVEKGIVTLAGHVSSLREKNIAERIARTVEGVHVVANDLLVVIEPELSRDDTALATAALDILAAHPLVPHEAIDIAVSNGWLTVGGVVEWEWQRREAEDALRGLIGLRGMTSRLDVRYHTSKSVDEHRVRTRAFEIFQKRNGGPGDAESDWYQAEAELQQEALELAT
jgi:osmotically-inducible protein OsmY